jgi:hypothetical protein
MTRLSLTIKKNGDTQVYDMIPAMSGSGAKYETKDQRYSLWEHQGTFTFAVDGIDESVCQKNEETLGTMSEGEARVIAEKMCIKGGEALSTGTYNENSKTWWFDANLNATKPGCNPACVVSDETKTAEINWRCTGLAPTE